MILDTRECNALAARLAGLKQNLVFGSPILQSRHSQIQNQLSALESFFRNLASMSEATETALQRRIAPVSSLPGIHFSGSASGSLAQLARARRMSVYGTAGYTLAAGSWSGSAGIAGGTVSTSFLDLSISGSASLRAFSQGSFRPELTVRADASARAAAISASGRVGTDLAALSASALGEAGAVYAGASMVLSMDEQVLKAQAGAAALRGECSLAIETAWGTLTFTASGSVASFEAGAGYESRPGQWAIEANGALLAGVGLRVQLVY